MEKYVFIIENMYYNLISVIHMCDQGQMFFLYSRKCEIRRDKSSRLVVTVERKVVYWKKRMKVRFGTRERVT